MIILIKLNWKQTRYETVSISRISENKPKCLKMTVRISHVRVCKCKVQCKWLKHSIYTFVIFRVCFVFRLGVIVFVLIYTKHDTRNTRFPWFVFSTLLWYSGCLMVNMSNWCSTVCTVHSICIMCKNIKLTINQNFKKWAITYDFQFSKLKYERSYN